MAEPDLTSLNLDVYDTRQGPWNPDHGEIKIPGDWDFLPSGDAFVTRKVKGGGVYWVAWRPRGKGRPHRRLLGLWAPSEAVERSRAMAEETAAERVRRREQGARQRARTEDRYRGDLGAAILDFLAFSSNHQELASQIAQSAAELAATVGSGRVGRTRTLPLGERAALAARAWIRHNFTGYEKELAAARDELGVVDEVVYRDLKQTASEAVDAFLAYHRD
jgi:hypothetical protein